MKSPEFSRYVGLPYEFRSYPGLTERDSLEINCISLIHRVYREVFGAELPKGLWARETLADESVVFETVQNGRILIGDIFVFGRKIPNDSPVFHLTLNTGQVDENGEPLLLHATHLNGRRSGVWPLSKFGEFERYERLHAVKRLRPDLFRAYIAPFV